MRFLLKKQNPYKKEAIRSKFKKLMVKKHKITILETCPVTVTGGLYYTNKGIVNGIS